ncbi:MAG: beta-N-acetylhexosaminidase [Terriglobales bacterium]
MRKPISIGQFLVIGFDGTELSSRLVSLLSKIQPAGVILFARNITGAEQTHRLLRECQRCVSAPLFTCVDLEGGQVDRFRNVLGPAPSAADVFATGDRTLFRKHGRVIGENCRALGFNVDFAPVLDLAFEASRKVMSSRAVSADPREVVSYVREFLLGLREAGVLGCGKHFPGLGEGKLDSHLELPVIRKSLKKMWVEDLVPYRTLRQKFPFVMVSHAAYPEVTGDAAPASLSKKWMTDILRKRVGYNGIIASDDMEMGAVQKFAPIEESVVEHIRAGGDLALICHSEELITRGYEALVRAAETDGRFRARVVESVRRVSKVRKLLIASSQFREVSSPSVHKVERLSRGLWEFGEEVRLAALDRPQVIPQKTRANLGHSARHSAQRHRAQRKAGTNEAERS